MYCIQGRIFLFALGLKQILLNTYTPLRAFLIQYYLISVRDTPKFTLHFAIETTSLSLHFYCVFFAILLCLHKVVHSFENGLRRIEVEYRSHVNIGIQINFFFLN